MKNAQAHVCDENIGHDVDVYLTGHLSTFGKIWHGEMGVNSACKAGRLKVVGAPYYVKNINKWLGTSQLATGNPRLESDPVP